MPKETFTMSDFSGGLNEISDATDIQKSNQVVAVENMDFAAKGFVHTYPVDRTFTDGIGNSTSLTIVDLDLGLGHATSTDASSLKLAIAVISSGASDDLSWEDGIYDFKYTVCKDLGNGVIEEGPLQKFATASTSPAGTDGALGVDMSADNMATFTFSESGSAFPSHMDADYATAFSICGRVYYSRIAGQGSVTQPGYIHLCDLIYTANSSADRIQPRAIGGVGDPNSDVITIEEPPTSSSFEMNAGYPSDVGIANSTTDFGTKTAVVTIGLVKYAAYTSGSTFYIYRNIPGHPDIWPTDNWIDMTAYGACLAMLDSGNLIVYFTADNVVLFDVTKDTVVKTLYGMGVHSASVPVKCGQYIVWSTGIVESDLTEFAKHLTYQARAFIFDGNQIKEITKQRILGVNKTTAIAYNKSAGHLRFGTGYGVPGDLNYYVYNLELDYWTALDTSGGIRSLTLPTITMGDPARLKKIYKIVVTCKDFDGASGNGTTTEIASITGTYAFIKNEDGTDIKTSFTQGSGGNIGVWSASAVKVRSLSIGLVPVKNNPLSSVSVVFRYMKKYSD